MKKTMYILQVSIILFFCFPDFATYLTAGEIHNAVMAGDLNKVRALIETNPGLLESKDDRGLPPLHIACEYGKVEIANFLIDKGADVNAMDNANYSPLIRACLFRDHLSM